MSEQDVGEQFEIVVGDGPLVATAIHTGHELRAEVADLMVLDDAQRLREEDPYTDRFTSVAPTTIIVHRSRFEVDLNRAPDAAVYLAPEDAWGLEIWRTPLPGDVLARSQALHAAYYDALRAVCDEKVERYGCFALLDIHSYNHRREGPDAEVDDPEIHPEINVGTGTMNRTRWTPLVDDFIDDLRHARLHGDHVDVRENVRFRGGYGPRWVHDTYPETGVALALEFKKIFMDEWTGVVDDPTLDGLVEVLRQAAEPLAEAMIAAVSRR